MKNTTITITKALVQAASKLQKSKIKTAALDAEILLTHVLKKDRIFLYTQGEYILKTSEKNQFLKLIDRRAKYEPVAYLISHRDFYDLTFKVASGVLIPRPETELLVDTALDFIRQKYQPTEKITVADIGTGSGAIIIALAKNLEKTKHQFLAIDTSAKAIKIATENAKLNKVKIKFIKGDLLKPIKSKKISVLLANLPYLKTDLKLKVADEKSIKYEPSTALYGGQDGLEVFRKFFKQIEDFKLAPDFIAIEIDSSQGASVSRLAKKSLPQYSIEVKKDFTGRNRLVVISKKEKNPRN